MRIAVLSDIHEDTESLRKVLGAIAKEGCDKIICLGDISGYHPAFYPKLRSPSASLCLKMLREAECVIIPGNHDLHSIRKVPEGDSFAYPANWYDLEIAEQRQLSGGSVWLYEEEREADFTSDDVAFLRSRPMEHRMGMPGLDLLFTHYVHPNLCGSSKDLYRHTWQFSEHFRYMENTGARVSFCGHAHIPDACMLVRPNDVHIVKNRQVIGDKSIIIVPALVKTQRKSLYIVFETMDRMLRIRKE